MNPLSKSLLSFCLAILFWNQNLIGCQLPQGTMQCTCVEASGFWSSWNNHSSRSVFSYPSSTGLVLDVVDGSNLGADVLQVRCIERPRGSISTGHWRLLLHWDLLGHGGFGKDPAAVTGVVTVGGGSRSSRGGVGDWARTGYKKKELSLHNLCKYRKAKP